MVLERLKTGKVIGLRVLIDSVVGHPSSPQYLYCFECPSPRRDHTISECRRIVSYDPFRYCVLGITYLVLVLLRAYNANMLRLRIAVACWQALWMGPCAGWNVDFDM